MKYSVHLERWPAIRPFRITGVVWDTFDSIVVELGRDGCVGRGEALGVYYCNETVDSLLADVERVGPRLEAGLDREELQTLLPQGARVMRSTVRSGISRRRSADARSGT